VAPERVADHEYGLGAAHPKSGGLEDRARVPGQ
jgi:hypothetical protein